MENARCRTPPSGRKTLMKSFYYDHYYVNERVNEILKLKIKNSSLLTDTQIAESSQ